jgi:uncharacterized membrane protein YeaQ/YmgE (transglycosylase-associated protein family)
MGIIISLIIGGIVGYAAGRIMHLKTSAIGYIALGIGGGLIGGVIASLLNLVAYGRLGQAALSLVGALLLILILRKLKWIQ